MKDFIKNKLNFLLIESKKTEYEYQVRDIGGVNLYYKKNKKDDIWDFIDEKEFNKKSNKENIVKFKNKKK